MKCKIILFLNLRLETRIPPENAKPRRERRGRDRQDRGGQPGEHREHIDSWGEGRVCNTRQRNGSHRVTRPWKLLRNRQKPRRPTGGSQEECKWRQMCEEMLSLTIRKCKLKQHSVIVTSRMSKEPGAQQHQEVQCRQGLVVSSRACF